MGHEFFSFSPGQDLKAFLEEVKPDVFITASHFFYRKFLDYKLLEEYRKDGMILLTKIDFWNSPLNKNRINEAPSMKDDKGAKRLIKEGRLGDYYFSTASRDDDRMKGFKEFAGVDFITIPLAADKIALIRDYAEEFASDIAFLGTNLPQKRQFFKEWLFPLRKKYDLKLYGQDWSMADQVLGLITKGGQFFNIPILRSLQKPKLQLGDEAKIYSSAKILVNLHEDYQRVYGGDCNERSFKIPFCGGLEISDDVKVLREYFEDGKEIIIAKDKDDWFKKIDYYMEHPDEAKKIADQGRKRALRDHTYHNRAQQILDLLSS
jgi:spore maturation protein CgeB